MKLELIEQRQALWTEYWDYVMQGKYNDISVHHAWFKKSLSVYRNISFDQWLYNNRHYELVDFTDFEPWEPMGRALVISTSDLDDRKLADFRRIWNESGIGIMYDKEPAVALEYLIANNMVTKMQ